MENLSLIGIHQLCLRHCLSAQTRPLLLTFRPLCTVSSDPKLVLPSRRKSALTAAVAKASASLLKENWLRSISTPLLLDRDVAGSPPSTEWVVGIDPDTSGAVALLKFGERGFSAQVFDIPHLQVMVGKRARKRPDARSIIQLLQSFGTPLGTIAYIEQSTPFPRDGKQGWWSGGYTYGLWIGILVASGFSVVPVPSRVWKDHFKLSGATSSKDDSRQVASLLFPSSTSMLKRKKDHGRAEALLIAAYGKGLKVPTPDADPGMVN